MVIIRLPAAAVLALSFSTVLYPCHADTFSAVPIADAFVATGTPTDDLSGDNFGAAGSLTVEAGNLPQGEFQTVIEFDLTGAQSYFNAEYSAGGWTAQTVSLKLTASAHGNSMFNPPAAGAFGISLMQNNSWVEGTGTGGALTTNGITYDSLESTYINNATDQALGTFSFGGGTSGTANYKLTLSSGLLGDLLAGTNLSLRLFPNDPNVSYLFNSRMAASNGPALLITVAPQAIPYQLALTLSGGNLVISWPTNESSGVVLQQNSVLSSTNWIATPTNFLTVTNGRYQVLASPTNAQQFFRLYTP